MLKEEKALINSDLLIFPTLLILDGFKNYLYYAYDKNKDEYFFINIFGKILATKEKPVANSHGVQVDSEVYIMDCNEINQILGSKKLKQVYYQKIEVFFNTLIDLVEPLDEFIEFTKTDSFVLIEQFLDSLFEGDTVSINNLYSKIPLREFLEKCEEIIKSHYILVPIAKMLHQPQ